MADEEMASPASAFSFQPRSETFGLYDRVKNGYMNANDFAFEQYRLFLVVSKTEGKENAKTFLLNVKSAVVSMYLNIVRPKLEKQLIGTQKEVQARFRILEEIEKRGYVYDPELMDKMETKEAIIYLVLIREFIERLGITKFELDKTDPGHVLVNELG